MRGLLKKRESKRRKRQLTMIMKMTMKIIVAQLIIQIPANINI